VNPLVQKALSYGSTFLKQRHDKNCGFPCNKSVAFWLDWPHSCSVMIKPFKPELLKHPERYTAVEPFGSAETRAEIEHMLAVIDRNLDAFGPVGFPSGHSEHQLYSCGGNIGWTSGFWTGMLWLAYELTRKGHYRNAAEQQVQSFHHRISNKIDVENHDMGFLFSLSCVAAWKLTGNKLARETALLAADNLMARFHEKPGIFQAWRTLEKDCDPDFRGRMIIDCLLNMPLLFWASEQSGNSMYRCNALRHINQTINYIVRENTSSHHTYFFDPETGYALHGKQHQGYDDNSTWSRGQTWGMLGFTLARHYTGDNNFLDLSRWMSLYYLNRLTTSELPLWDFDVPATGPQHIDSSAAAIAACAFLEQAKQLPPQDPYRLLCQNAAWKTLRDLQQHCSSSQNTSSNGLLLHSVRNMNKNMGVDECSLWGDYFYMEALVRNTQIWDPYW